MPQPPLVVVGSLNLDLVFHLSRPIAAGETQTARAFTRAPGGKGANQAVAAARLGATTSMLGCVGSDDAGDLLLHALRSAGISTQPVERTTEATGTAAILLAASGENSIVVAPGANALLSPALLQRHAGLLTSAGILLTQLETPTNTLAALLRLASASGLPVMLDPAPAAALPAELLHQVCWFTPNETEAGFYAKRAALPAASAVSAIAFATAARTICQELRSLGPRNILLKLGARGAAVLTESGEWFYSAAPSVGVVDTTGAGDTLNAAFAVALLREDAMPAALRFAVSAASISVTRPGAMTASPTLAEVASLAW